MYEEHQSKEFYLDQVVKEVKVGVEEGGLWLDLVKENNMAAVELEWIPETLYNTAISAVVDNYGRSRRDIRSLPENIQFDVYYKVRRTVHECIAEQTSKHLTLFTSSLANKN